MAGVVAHQKVCVESFTWFDSAEPSFITGEVLNHRSTYLFSGDRMDKNRWDRLGPSRGDG